MKPQAMPLVISASRRTDIPNYYARWFLQRVREGYVLVRNVRDYHQVRKVGLAPSQVACFVFWTKNPSPMLPLLCQLSDFPSIFHYTITPYGGDLEPRVPPIGESIDCFRRLSDMIGKERIIWRYDPIIINKMYPMGYHMEIFASIAERLEGYTERCMFSFVDRYRHLESRLSALGVEEVDAIVRDTLAAHLAQQASSRDMQLFTCAEPDDFSSHGIARGACIDASLIERICGFAIEEQRDKTQRPYCRCAPSVDVGMYHTCLNLCAYCYANHSEQRVHAAYAQARVSSPLITGLLERDDVVSPIPFEDAPAQLSLFSDQVP